VQEQATEFAVAGECEIETGQARSHRISWARGRRVGKLSVDTPWEGRFWNHTVRDGMRIPLDGEVAWLLPEGRQLYWARHDRLIAIRACDVMRSGGRGDVGDSIVQRAAASPRP